VETAKNNGPAHNIGKNGSINGRQWRRLTKAELLAVARNMGIPQVSGKMAPANIAQYIINKAHPRAVILPPHQPKPVARSPSSAGSNNNNFALELEFMGRLQGNLKNVYETGNEAEFMKIYTNLPTGARGKPLKAAVNSAYKQFIKNQFLFRGREMPKKPRKPRAPANQTLNYVYNIPKNSVNFSNALEKAGLNSGRNWTWNEIRAALKDKMTAAQLKKLKAQWNTNVVAKLRSKTEAVGPLKRKVSRKKN
jgi:hypothetical protein